MRPAFRPSARLAAIAAITLAAGILRFVSLHRVALDPFYDAAVRSMSASLHNFFFGAFEPGASVSIDKPPADLWLQVLSVKLFGFGPVALKLPEALAATAAVPLLYDTIRRPFGAIAGLCSALVLAVLPIAVLTARSDTMDSVMMLLTVVALWLLLRYHESGEARWLYLAAAAIGVAFNVKLFEAFVALPALALLVLLPATAPLRTRLLRAAIAGCVLVAISLSWLLATLLAPAHDRPFAIGSSNGSAWNAAFVFNGTKRIGGTATEFSPAPTRRANVRPPGNSEPARAAIPIGPPGALRLFDHDGPLSGLRLGFLLVVALALGVPALIAAIVAARRAPDANDGRAPPDAVAIVLLVWLAIGIVLFSTMTHLHPRYTEAFTPAVAAACGVGFGWVARGSAAALAAAAVTALVLLLYGHGLLGSSGIWLLTAAAALVAVAAATAAQLLRRRPLVRIALPALLLAALALPVSTDASQISHHESDSGHTGSMRPELVRALSVYLRAHRGRARYELAVVESTQASSLIVSDAQPVLVLTALAGRPLVSAAALQRQVGAGAVRYAYVGGPCGPHESRRLAVCTPIAAWIRAHGRDVSRAAGLAHPSVLWLLQTR